ncbi:MAG: nucleotidyltransferase family protein, partial [Pseudomonas sp.]
VKLRATLPDGSTVLQQTLARLYAATPHLTIVTRDDLLPDVERALAALPMADAQSVRVEICRDAHLGMGHTLAHGMRQLPDWHSVLICLADMPGIRSETYARMLAALTPEHILIPVHQGHNGQPVGFGSHFFDALRNSSGDVGGREVVRANRQHVQQIQTDDGGILHDIDTREDLSRLHP